MTMITCGLIHALPPSDRRVFGRPEAASFVGASVGYFDKLVRAGIMPQPLSLPGGVKRWDVRALNKALDGLSGISESEDSESEDSDNEWDRLVQ
ncbi:XRE family transcriptional regulator [Mesorhizobium sp.]|uniref:helix-turn-helix transcriptional regulator n=1 Tax=Mesorhizobium sp. TaxID=1871066 RepID=UPI000FE777AB|nr:XRE family transcriptional regulator [Mesorhizobium sp.]RWK41123.1 MAG: XRE family transcriptional regulator [Mesorhizobium sp.]RWK67765.1 MAG: XRE family transcriptional regulator [Mesorhizobium sp.]RWK78133.1 MAG: XRE family transcriptional regulator [Mesorhizobium sp.]RWK80443.1 MAG: XRE family transcriptional regulator [Mesorhizobium sp.]RWL03895.1 MAG: XRE family transcriptional regulator [Mesorhizobium sp.]